MTHLNHCEKTWRRPEVKAKMAVKLPAAIWAHLHQTITDWDSGSRRAESEVLVVDQSGGVGALGKMFRCVILPAGTAAQSFGKKAALVPTVVAASRGEENGERSSKGQKTREEQPAAAGWNFFFSPHIKCAYSNGTVTKAQSQITQQRTFII